MGLPEHLPAEDPKAVHHEGRFLYFAFGSNLLEERLHISCPSARRVYPGKLNGYRLTFNYNSLRWRGHVATICEDEDSSLWGEQLKTDRKKSEASVVS